MSGITTHALDTARGRPAAGLPVVLERRAPGGGWERLGGGVTDADGRAKDLLAPGAPLETGVYRLTFDTGAYDRDGFYPEVSVVFTVQDAGGHYHVPLLLSPHQYTTYRGS